MGDSLDWALVRLAGEKASKGKNLEKQKKIAATYLHYLLLARPDFLVAQGLLTTKSSVWFLVGTAGVGIQQLEVKWGDEDLKKVLYAFIYRLYAPSKFADPSYTRTGYNEATREVTYTVRMKSMEYTDFRPIHARNPFATRTHILSKPSSEPRAVTVLKDQLCRSGRRFDEWTFLSKIHQQRRVPGVVETVDHETIEAPLSPGRKIYRLGLRQTGSPFTSISTAKRGPSRRMRARERSRCSSWEITLFQSCSTSRPPTRLTAPSTATTPSAAQMRSSGTDGGALPASSSRSVPGGKYGRSGRSWTCSSGGRW